MDGGGHSRSGAKACRLRSGNDSLLGQALMSLPWKEIWEWVSGNAPQNGRTIFCSLGPAVGPTRCVRRNAIPSVTPEVK